MDGDILDWKERYYFWLGGMLLKNEIRSLVLEIPTVKMHFSRRGRYSHGPDMHYREDTYNYTYPYICCVSVRDDYVAVLRKRLEEIRSNYGERCIWTDSRVISHRVVSIDHLSVLIGKTVVRFKRGWYHFKIGDFVYNENGKAYRVDSVVLDYPKVDEISYAREVITGLTTIVVERDFVGKILQEMILYEGK